MSSSVQFYSNTAAYQEVEYYGGTSNATETTLPLSSAYSYGVSGAANAFAFTVRDSANLTDFWVKVISYTGTWGSTNGTINVEIREGLNASLIPGTTLTGSFTVTLDGVTTGWIKTTGLSIALTAGKMYTCVVGDSDGGATNFVTIGIRAGTGVNGVSAVAGGTFTTTNGYSTAGSTATGSPEFVLRIGTLLYTGGGFSSVSTTTSSTKERGIRFKPAEDCTLVGVAMGQDQQLLYTASNQIKLYADASTPGGTAILTYTIGGTALGGGSTPVVSTLPFTTANQIDLTGGTWYRLVIKPAAASTVPRQLTIGGSPDVDVKAAIMPFSGNAHWTIDNGSGGWDDTQTASLPNIGPVLAPHSASGTSGGSFIF